MGATKKISAPFSQTVLARVTAAISVPDPVVGADWTGLVERVEREHVLAARAAGATWNEVAKATGYCGPGSARTRYDYRARTVQTPRFPENLARLTPAIDAAQQLWGARLRSQVDRLARVLLPEGRWSGYPERAVPDLARAAILSYVRTSGARGRTPKRVEIPWEPSSLDEVVNRYLFDAVAGITAELSSLVSDGWDVAALDDLCTARACVSIAQMSRALAEVAVSRAMEHGATWTDVAMCTGYSTPYTASKAFDAEIRGKVNDYIRHYSRFNNSRKKKVSQ